MHRRHTAATAALCASALLAASSARADRGSSYQLTLGVGVSDRATTGTGASLAGYGYDAQSSGMVSLEGQTLFALDEYFDHGLSAQVSATGAQGFGLGDPSAFRLGVVDVGYVFRASCPCMSHGMRRVYISGLAGLTVLMADAGTGSAPASDTSRWNERTAASSALDHTAVGWVLGLSGDVHFGALALGVTLSARQAWGVGTAPVAREWLPSAMLRVGLAFDSVSP